MRILQTGIFIIFSFFITNSTMAGGDPLLERGTYLMNSIVACGNCHTPKNPDGTPIAGMEMAGNYTITEPDFVAYAPNISMDVETGIGGWTDEEIIRAIREGKRPDGTTIGPPMPNIFYRNVSDTDVRAIVAYLRTVPPVKNTVPSSEYQVPLPDNWGPPVVSVPDVSKDDPVAYGRYMAHTLGHCTDCHTPIEKGKHIWEKTGLGGRLFEGIYALDVKTVSQNITPHDTAGIGQWKDEEIKRAIRDGVSRNGRKLANAMGFHYYKNIADEDMDAIVAYLKSLPLLSPIE